MLCNLKLKGYFLGNRWLRPQRPAEFKTLDMIEYPKKRHRDAWHYFKILECCQHFSTLRSKEAKSNSIQVTLLTAEEKCKKASGENSEKKEAVNTEEIAQKLSKCIMQKIENVESLLVFSSCFTDIRVEKINDFLKMSDKPAKFRRRGEGGKKINKESET